MISTLTEHSGGRDFIGSGEPNRIVFHNKSGLMRSKQVENDLLFWEINRPVINNIERSDFGVLYKV